MSADLIEAAFLLKVVLQGDDIGDVAALDQFGNDLKDFGMYRVGEMLRFQKLRNFFKALLLARMAPRRACSASRFCGSFEESISIVPEVSVL